MQHMREILGAPLITYDVHNQPKINGSIVIILDTHNCVLVGDTTHYLTEEELFQKTNLGKQFSVLVRNIVPYDTSLNGPLTPGEKNSHDQCAISHMANKIQTIKNWLISKTTNHPQLEAAKAYIAEHIPPAVRQRIDAKSVITAEDQDQINRLVPNILQQRIAFNSDKKYSYGSPNIQIWSMLNIQSINPGLPFPKGNIDRRENSSACALREVFEETGIQLNEANLKKSGHYKILADFFKFEETGIQLNEANLKKSGHYKILPDMQIPELRKYEIFYYFLNANEEANAVATITRKNSSSVAELHNLRFDQLLSPENIIFVQKYNNDENCADPPNWGQEGRAPWAAPPASAAGACKFNVGDTVTFNSGKFRICSNAGVYGIINRQNYDYTSKKVACSQGNRNLYDVTVHKIDGTKESVKNWGESELTLVPPAKLVRFMAARRINSALDAIRRLQNRTIEEKLAQMRERRGYQGGYYEKYIKYKTKYLELKNMKN